MTNIQHDSGGIGAPKAVVVYSGGIDSYTVLPLMAGIKSRLDASP